MAQPIAIANRTSCVDSERTLQAAPEDGQHNLPVSSLQPCPVGASKPTSCLPPDPERTGRPTSRTCTDDRLTDEGTATVATFARCEQGEAAQHASNQQSSEPKKSETDGPDVIELVCRDKSMPRDAFMQFGVTIVKRGRSAEACARVSVYNETGEIHSHCDFVPRKKELKARGKGSSGMFFPGRLPAAGETWLLVKGCEDAAALVGLGFNAAGLPTNCLAAEYASLFNGVDVVLVPYLDELSQSGAQRSGGHVKGIAASVTVARLPGEITATSGKGVRDALARSDGEKKVREAIAIATPWQPRGGEHDAKDGRPEVLVNLNYGWTVDQVLKHLGKLGWDSPWIPARKGERLKLFHRGGSLVHVSRDDDEKPCIRPLPQPQLTLRIQDACQLMVERETDEGIERAATAPPKWLVDGVFTRGDFAPDIRRLIGIINAPTLRADGTILQAAGWDSPTGLLYAPNANFPTVPQNPTIEDAKRAAAELLEVVADFEFVGDTDRSAWLALVLSQVGREAIAGCVPLFAITATTRGSGKGLLCDAASLIVFGHEPGKSSYSTDDVEMGKHITAVAMEALPTVNFDNIDRVLGGAALDAALTAMSWSGRVLGASRTTGTLPMRTVWTATGNNLRFGSDLGRRVLPIRLAPTCENPEERTDFAHANLLGWIRENRPRLAVAALTLLRAYFMAGRPEQPNGVWGSFESWSALVRGSIVWAGLADPLATRATAKADDQSGAMVRGLIGGLLEVDQHGDGLTVREIADELNDDRNAGRFPALREVVTEVATYRGQIDQKRLGYALRKYRGRIANGYKIEGEPGHSGIVKWSAQRQAPHASGFGGDGGDGGDQKPTPYATSVCVTHRPTQDTHATHTGAHWEPGETCPPSQPSPPQPPDPASCDHNFVDVHEGQTIKTECNRCGKFRGRRPVKVVC